LPASDEAALREAGYADDPLGDNASGLKALWHPEAMLPRVLLAPKDLKHPSALAIRPELSPSLLRFTESRTRSKANRSRVSARCSPSKKTMQPSTRSSGAGIAATFAASRFEKISGRARALADAPPALGWRREGYAYSLDRLQQVIDLVGRDLACHLVLRKRGIIGRNAIAPGSSRSGGRIR